MIDAAHRTLWHRHPAVRTGDELTTGERAVDASVRGIGSWPFLIVQTAIVCSWIGLNLTGLARFDLYPFILLNLAFSTQAAYATPLILLGQRRQDTKNAEVALHTSNGVDQVDGKVDTVLSKLDELLETDRSSSR